MQSNQTCCGKKNEFCVSKTNSFLKVTNLVFSSLAIFDYFFETFLRFIKSGVLKSLESKSVFICD